MRVRHSILALLGTMLAFGSLGETPPAPDPNTGIEGTIMVSPSHGGPIRADIPSSKPLAGATFVVAKESGAVTEFTTDDQGRFRVSVPPGKYSVSMKGRKGRVGYFGPFEVEVIAGQTTKVEWQCDSGMR